MSLCHGVSAHLAHEMEGVAPVSVYSGERTLKVRVGPIQQRGFSMEAGTPDSSLLTIVEDGYTPKSHSAMRFGARAL